MDLVIAEDDGVIIVPSSIAAEVAEVARERLAAEEKQLRVFSEDGPMLFENYADNYKSWVCRSSIARWFVMTSPG